MAKSSPLQPFVIPPDDPLAAEHAAVLEWVETAFTQLGEHNFYQDVDLKSLPCGATLLAGTPEQSRRYVLAAVAQTRHWDRLVNDIRNAAKSEFERANSHFHPDWPQVWGRRRQAAAVVFALTRRNLPFERTDLLELLAWCAEGETLNAFWHPVGNITRALQRFVAAHRTDRELATALRGFAERLRASADKDCKRFATPIEQLCADQQRVETTTPAAAVPAVPVLPAPRPAPAGSDSVLSHLKRTLRMLPANSAGPATVIGPDHFELPDDSPLPQEHALVSEAFQQVIGTPHYSNPHVLGQKVEHLLRKHSPEMRGDVLLAAAERHVQVLLTPSPNFNEAAVWQSRYAATALTTALIDRDFTLFRPGTFDLLLYLSTLSSYQRPSFTETITRLISDAARFAAESPLTEGERYVLSLVRASLISGPPLGNPGESVATLTSLISDGAQFFLAPGEAWSDAVNNDLTHVDAGNRAPWLALLRHALTATSSRPSAKWLKAAQAQIDAIGEQTFGEALARWLPLVAQGQSIRRFGNYAGDTRGGSDTMHDENATCLRGLLWCVPLLTARDQLARHVTAVALSAYRKVPGVGPRAVKVGNGAVYALSELASKEAVGQLAMLKVRVKFGSAQKEIEKAFTAAAEALQLPRDQIEELGVPSYGLEEVGRLTEELAGYTAQLLVSGSSAELHWSDPIGKPLKSVPAKVKSECKDEWKDLQQSLKDIQAMLPAQRDRIDGMFLLQKSWSIADWRERYHDHPLVGTIARRLLWCVDGTPAFFQAGIPCDVTGAAIAHGKTAEITLWHPIGQSLDAVVAWRRRLEDLRITQPFKQAYREVYLLTDAERNTRTYSNRFAAHILRQHQFNALCAARGWKNRLRLMVDDSYPPATRELPQWGLRAEFWIEGVGQDYGTDTNDSGVFLRLATDQVRFYRTGAAVNFAHAGGGGYTVDATGPGEGNINEPVSLDQVPALVFSEVMRDVDLFVGVASVGADPAWQDGGPEGRYQTYWNSYAFGELAGSAATRKDVLERLVPRLKIAKRCSFSDRFLIVRGDLRTYKIHLGSGNILMEPNDQYLCIVPDSRSRGTDNDLYLPFEGDSTLSIILSKALMLADDTKIKDPTITRQIKG